MQQPEGFFSNPYLVCRLKKSLWSWAQAPKAWYANIDGFLLSLSFVLWNYYPNVYLKLIHGYFMIIFLYVDDLLITGSSTKEISSLKDAMNHAFSMTDLGLLSQFLGLEITQSQHESKYIIPSMPYIFWTSSTWNIAIQARLPSFQELRLKK